MKKYKKILKIWSLLQKWSGPIGGDLYRDHTTNNKLDSDFKVKYEQKKIEEETKKEKERKEHEERKAKIRAKIEFKQQPIIECTCGSQFQKREQKRHDKCQQHVEYIKSQQAQQTTK